MIRAKVIPRGLVSLCPIELNAPLTSNPWSLQVNWVTYACSELSLLRMQHWPNFYMLFLSKRKYIKKTPKTCPCKLCGSDSFSLASVISRLTFNVNGNHTLSEDVNSVIVISVWMMKTLKNSSFWGSSSLKIYPLYPSMWSFRKSSKCRDIWEELELTLINLESLHALC